MAEAAPLDEPERLVPLVVLDGTPGADVIDGTAADDTLRGGAGDDVLRGFGGSDLLFGQGGDDQLFGGGGGDGLLGGQGNDFLSAGRGDDTLNGAGGADRLEGKAGGDLLLGGGGDDELSGGGGRDALLGNNGADTLLGGGGRDLLEGKLGFDTLTGGGGVDTFAMTVLDDKPDQVTDLNLAIGEIVDVSELLPLTVTDANLGDFVRQTTVGNDLLIELSPEGNGDFVEVASLQGLGSTALTAAQLGLGLDPPGDLSTTASLAVGDFVIGRIEPGTDTDWYRIELVVGETYRFDLEGSPTGVETLADPVLALYDPVGVLAARNDDGGFGLDSLLEVTAPFSGTWFLSAESFEETTGNYVLSATLLDGPTTTAAATGALAVEDVLAPAGNGAAAAGEPSASVDLLPSLLTPADPAQAAVG